MLVALWSLVGGAVAGCDEDTRQQEALRRRLQRVMEATRLPVVQGLALVKQTEAGIRVFIAPHGIYLDDTAAIAALPPEIVASYRKPLSRVDAAYLPQRSKAPTSMPGPCGRVVPS